ncbi:alpha/beta-hydrolase [Gymnopus androsaceus JB14]|uniref:Alpha/beta-hydrolase n=1 Tax=Gymnopus androsaceus JB14 TaxID=1447944 RepID=A0A6A4IQ16_9AGAR|nr:alpha/beta-hydrolase [Gymnopus androsaceus JB14]
MALLQIQPFRGIYLTYHFFSTVFIRIPLWILLAIPKSWRPRATWSISRAGPLFGTPPNHLAITPGVNVNGVWIPPIPELIKNELAIWANVAQVASIRIPGYWLHKEGSSITVAAPLMPGEKVVYALHGGGYVRLSAHPTDPTSNIARGLINHVGCVHRVFSTEYRLSSSLKSKEPNPFPAALIDALAGYVYLVKTVGLDPSDIIVEGDSAGGNLALALTRYLVEHPDSGLPPPPGALILLSAWADLGPQALNPNSSWMNHAKSDYIGLVDVEGYYRAIRTFVGPHGLGAAETNPIISPASLNPAMKIHFKGFPRTFIAAGGAEIRWLQILGEGDGVRPGDGKVRFYVAADATHDWVALPLPKFEPERTETLEAIAAWVDAS